MPNSAATSLRCVLHRLRHSQPTVHHCRQLHAPLHTELQSNQPATFLAAEFDGSFCETIIHAFARLCKKHITHVCESEADTVCGPYARCLRLWDRPQWSPSAMSAVALTHCNKIRGSIAQNCKYLRGNKRQRAKDRERSLQQLRLQSF